jgi:ribosomal protein L44E
MAETLGMLCDKLTIVKLKQYHSEDESRLHSLARQCKELQDEIDEYIADSLTGQIPVSKMTFDANKIFKKEGNELSEVNGSFGEVFYRLADVNCRLWHEQEKVYDFENVPPEEKNKVVKQLALLNLERNQCIDKINKQFANAINSLKNN